MLRAGLAAAAMMGFSSAASAAPIPLFPQITNDGVYSIDPALAASLGLTGATHIGVIGLRSTDTPSAFAVGDTFDAATLFDSTADDGAILGFLNAFSTSLSYTGAELASLGTTEILLFDRAGDNRIFNAAFFGFSTSGNIVFNGTSTYNAGQSRGDFAAAFDVTAPIPLPGAAWLMLTGLAGFFGWRRRAQRKAAVAA